MQLPSLAPWVARPLSPRRRPSRPKGLFDGVPGSVASRFDSGLIVRWAQRPMDQARVSHAAASPGRPASRGFDPLLRGDACPFGVADQLVGPSTVTESSIVK